LRKRVPSAVAAADRPLTAAREELRRTITIFATAQKAAQAAGLPVERLNAVIAEHERLSARLRECYAADRAQLAELIAAGDSVRTHTSPETEATNSACADLREAYEAARQGMPAAEKAQAEAIAALGTPGRGGPR
jgi:hypothetical protein